jgi:hypothetical protein
MPVQSMSCGTQNIHMYVDHHYEVTNLHLHVMLTRLLFRMLVV